MMMTTPKAAATIRRIRVKKMEKVLLMRSVRPPPRLRLRLSGEIRRTSPQVTQAMIDTRSRVRQKVW